MFNIIINIKNIINIIINNFLKNIITIKKNYRFDLKGKIKNYYYCCCCCRRRRYFYYYYD
jgi:hypothetical protein